MKQIFAIAVVLLGSCVSNVLYAETQEFHISIGYATPSVSNIGSSFGHSFLLVHSGTPSLQDTAYSYVVEDIPASTLTKLKAGFDGSLELGLKQYQLHEQIRYYANIESRDIYLYQLRLTPDQVNQILQLLHNSDFVSYHFTSQNCATQLENTLISAGVLQAENHHFDTPLRLINRIKKSDLVEETFYIQNAVDLFLDDYRALTTYEQDQFHEYLDVENKFKTNRDVSTAVLSYLDLPEKINSFTSDELKALLNGIQIQDPAPKTQVLPSDAIDPSRNKPIQAISIGAGTVNKHEKDAFARIEYRLGASERDAFTYQRLGQAVVPFEFSLLKGEEITQVEYSLFDVQNFNEFEPFFKRPSWSVAAYGNYTNTSEEKWNDFVINAKIGLTLFPSHNNRLFAGANFDCGWQQGAACQIGSYLDFASRLNSALFFNAGLIAGHKRTESEISLSADLSAKYVLEFYFQNTQIGEQLGLKLRTYID